EPCCHQGKTGPCTKSLIHSGIKRVIAAMEDPNPLVAGKGLAELRSHDIEVEAGLLKSEAELLNRGFIKRMSVQMPWVTVKTATSLDGMTALNNGKSKWITSDLARLDVHHLRAKHDAIMTGIGTVKADDPSLNVRLNEDIEFTHPIRVIIDTNLEMPIDAKMLSLTGKTLIFTAQSIANSELSKIDTCEIVHIDEIQTFERSYLSLSSILSELAKRGVNSVMVEAGATLVGSLFKHQLVDELITYVAPKLMGDASKGVINLGVIESMNDCLSLKFNDIRKVGEDLRIISSVIYSKA
ncbi:MAG: bifunctional diaminohydroxyphosphoribosylaminopyrimidine deaminase/5-amino-6-(5-phosphoribosylamino)uracil reductase RibD, partial [Pseudomonadota bacterium]